jgi:hypothetical protein
MITQESLTFAGVSEDSVHANQAITKLQQAGFTRIGVSMRHNKGVPEAPFTVSENDSRAAERALAGARGRAKSERSCTRRFLWSMSAAGSGDGGDVRCSAAIPTRPLDSGR